MIFMVVQVGPFVVKVKVIVRDFVGHLRTQRRRWNNQLSMREEVWTISLSQFIDSLCLVFSGDIR